MIKTVFVLFLSVNFVMANEAPAEGEQGEKKEAAPVENKVGKELADAEKLVASLSAKIKAKSDSVELLLKQKAVEKDPQKLSELLKFVQQEHRDLEKLTKEYNTALNVLQYRFPERGVTIGRRYQRLNTKSLEEMEKAMGLDVHLNKTRENVKRVYGVKDKPKKVSTPLDEKNRKDDESLLKPATLSK